MIEPLLTTALTIDSLKLILPYPPVSQVRTADNVYDLLNDAKKDLRIHHNALHSERSFTNGALFLVDAEREIDQAAADMQNVVGYITDLRDYARFWRRLALKLVQQYEPSRPLIYKPFNEV